MDIYITSTSGDHTKKHIWILERFRAASRATDLNVEGSGVLICGHQTYKAGRSDIKAAGTRINSPSSVVRPRQKEWDVRKASYLVLQENRSREGSVAPLLSWDRVDMEALDGITPLSVGIPTRIDTTCLGAETVQLESTGYYLIELTISSKILNCGRNVGIY